jgi:predicted aspartyl protease
MGLTDVELEIANPAKPRQRVREKFLVDSGAFYTVAPRTLLRRLGIRPHTRHRFVLADGEVVERQVGDALFYYGDRRGASPVIFGKRGDSNLLGVVTLESLGLILDPLRRELKPARMMLADL